MEPTRLGLIHQQHDLDSTYECIESLIDTFSENSINSVTLTGGEPTLRKDFFQILHKLTLTNISVTVQTNGRILSTDNSLHLLSQLPHRNVLFVIALHSSSRSIHDTITQKNGSFDETTLAIKKLTELGFPLSGKMVLSNYNINDINSTLNLMHTLGIKDAIVAYPHAEDFTKDALYNILPRYYQVRQSLMYYQEKSDFPVFYETIPFCCLPNQNFFKSSIDLDYLKMHLTSSEIIIEMTMIDKQIKWEESRKSIKLKTQKCNLCLLSSICEGAWAEYYDIFNDEDLIPITDPNIVEIFINSL
jgi:MoaA/NifB/PqqE/SkfB family radical SAM enzyme